MRSDGAECVLTETGGWGGGESKIKGFVISLTKIEFDN